MFLQHMHAYCKQSGEWSHSLDACWKVAQQCGMQMEPNDFKAVLTILMSDREQKILVRKTKRKQSGAEREGCISLQSSFSPRRLIMSLCPRLLGHAERTERHVQI